VKNQKRDKLEAAGWRVGSGDEFLKLSADESRQVTESMPPLITTPSPGRYMATVDFRMRGFQVAARRTCSTRPKLSIACST